MMLQSRKNQGLVRGCIVPILAVVGILAACFLACLILFNLNQASVASSGTGSTFFLLFG